MAHVGRPAFTSASVNDMTGNPTLRTTQKYAAQNPAADYPNKPVKIVVTVPAGGGVDTATRIFAEKLQQKLGHPFVIENRGGAGGNVAAETVFVAPPDGMRRIRDASESSFRSSAKPGSLDLMSL